MQRPPAASQAREIAARLQAVRRAIVSGLDGTMGIDLDRVAQTGASKEAIARAARAARSEWSQARNATSFFLWYLRREMPQMEPSDRRSGPRTLARAEWQRPLGRPDDRQPGPPTGAVLSISPAVTAEEDRRSREESLAGHHVTIAQTLSDEDRVLRAKTEALVNKGDLYEMLMTKFPKD